MKNLLYFLLLVLVIINTGCKKDTPADNTNPSPVYTVVVKTVPSGASVIKDHDSTFKITPDVFTNVGGSVSFKFQREACKDTIVNVFIKNNDSVVVKLRDSVDAILSYNAISPDKINVNVQFSTNVIISFYSIKTPTGSFSFNTDTANSFLKGVPTLLRQGVPFSAGSWDVSIKGKLAEDTSFTFFSRSNLDVK